ncbi:10584_t:CDS:2 [Dentiscutata erythropus]|uniref:10584_t:CDS:1 n=1 Tax=Dentiscutata erythropus TaxID=1348616 RepID=A0A9N9CIP0_9GLOM|nr:10584_t:CDS:2 [Dentiscutata erythropus]
MALQTLWTIYNRKDHYLIVDSSEENSNKFKIEYLGSDKRANDSTAIRTNQSISLQQEFYFEVTISNKEENGIIGIGFYKALTQESAREVSKQNLFEEALTVATKEVNEFINLVKEGDIFKEDFNINNLDVLPLLAANKENFRTMLASLIENQESLAIIKEWVANAIKNFNQLTRTTTINKKIFTNILTLLNKFLNEESCEINKNNTTFEHILEILKLEADKSAANVNLSNEQILEEAALHDLAKILADEDINNDEEINDYEKINDYEETLLIVPEISHKMVYIKEKFLIADEKKKKLLKDNISSQSSSNCQYISKHIDTRDIRKLLNERISKTIDIHEIQNMLSTFLSSYDWTS